MKTDLEAKTRSLTRLAQLLQRRYGKTKERSFVMMMADLRWIRRKTTDDVVTQQIQTFRSVP